MGIFNNKIIVFIMCGICAVWASPGEAAGQGGIGDNPFPVPEVIESNVTFWTNVYATYATNQGIVHDSEDLSIIYDVIDLKAYDTPGAGKINRKRIKQGTNKYRHILTSLASKPGHPGREQRRVAAMYNHTKDSRIYRRAAGRIRCQVGQKDRFRAGLIRSGAFIDQIRDILHAHSLPQDLAYLPHVESSFNPNAYSKFGAAGIWQFTRSTGKRFMRVAYAVDERRDPILSTYAAAQLIKENYEKLDSWPLAITAYNHGATGMLRAQKAHGDYATIVKKYRSRTFKFASRNFYAEFLAARQVAAYYHQYFGPLTLNQPTAFHTMVLDGYLAFEDASRHFGVNAETLSKINPALRTPVINGQKHIPKGYALRLPVHASGQIRELMAAVPETLYHGVQKPSHFYTVQRHDTAGKIARMHGVKLTDLILANNLDRRATIYPRQTLRIPLPGESPKPKTVLAAKTEPKAAPLPKRHRNQPEGDPTTMRASAENLPAPASTYPEPVLASLIPLPLSSNEIDSAWTKCQPLSQAQATNDQVVMADVAFETLLQDRDRPIGTLRVEIEETLGHYAEWAGVRTQQIRYLNNLRYGTVLRLHQRIKVPLYRTTAQNFTQRRYEFHKRLQEDFFSVYQITEVRPYTVSSGDNYWTLCRQKFDIPLWLLKHYNPGADLADLKVGQMIVIPEIEKAASEDAASTPMETEI